MSLPTDPIISSPRDHLPAVPRLQDLQVATLGPCTFRSPLPLSNVPLDGLGDFTPDDARVRYQHEIGPHVPPCDDVSFEKSGPREMLFFEPCNTSAAIVTCGGLCPGLNNVIRSLFLELRFNYCVNRILGIRNGYLGFNPASGLAPIELTPDFVEDIHYLGGTVLGSSRGPQDVKTIVDFLVGERIDLVFCIGGDGTMRGAHEIHEEAARRGLKKAIVGIPKTIDNDIPYVWQTFGYATALEKAEEVLRGAHVEARGAINGIGLVKLMGRDAGFIAAGAALASQEVNFVLVPEVRFPLLGENGFLDVLERRLARRGHALIALAEGAGQHLVPQHDRQRDPSGNLKPVDIGPFLRERILQHFGDRKIDVTLKYIDPSYFIRSVPANAADRILCDLMARHAAHAAMAGKTDVLIGLWDNDLTHVPISAVTKAGKKQLDTAGDQWMAVLSITGQPIWM